MKASNHKRLQEIMDTLPLPMKYLQRSPRKKSLDGYDSDSSHHEEGQATKVSTRRVRVPRGTFGSRNSDSVPTAHVQPTTAVRAGPLRATQQFTWDEPRHAKRSASPDLYLQTATTKADDLHSRLLSSDNMRQRSHSMSNLQDSFRELAMDTDPTLLDEPRLALPSSKLVTRELGVEGHGQGYISDITREDVRSRLGLHTVSSHYLQDSILTPSFTSRRQSHDLYNTRSSAPLTADGAYSAKSKSMSYGGLAPSTAGLQVPVGPSSAPLGRDITEWQQRHQDQLRRQYIDMQQPTFATPSQAVCSIPREVPGHEAIRRAADEIIREKDMIIERQKSRIQDLEHWPKSSLDSAHMRPSSRLTGKEDSLYGRTTPGLGTALMDSSSTSQITILESKLGETEYEIIKLKEKHMKELASKNAEILEMQQKLEDALRVTEELRTKYDDTKASNDKLKEQVSQLRRYMHDLPTVDDQTRNSQEIKALKDDKARYKSRQLQLEKKLAETTKQLHAKADVIESLERIEKELHAKVSSLQEENEKLQCRLRESQAGVDAEELERLRSENEQLKRKTQEAKKLLDSKHRKLQQQESRHQTASQQLQERLEQEEATVAALRQEVDSKDAQLGKLRVSTKELGSQKQDLMEKLMVLQERLREQEQAATSTSAKLQRRLLLELASCFSELQALVEVCVQKARGQDPNVSTLLGIRESPNCEPEESWVSQHDVASLERRIAKVRELRQDVAKVKDNIATQYAEDMGENMNCTQQ